MNYEKAFFWLFALSVGLTLESWAFTKLINLVVSFD